MYVNYSHVLRVYTEQPTYMQGVVDRLIMLTFMLHVCLAARDIANDKETNMKVRLHCGLFI